MKKVLDEASNKMSYVKEGISKVRSKPWAEPVGIAMGATASICGSLNFVPGMGIIGGALKMGSSLLNPAPSLADLVRSQQQLEANLSEATGVLKDIIEQKLGEIKNEMQQPRPETIQDFELIRAEVQATALAISNDMRKIDDDLSDIKNIIDRTYQIVTDIRYRDGIEKVDTAYQIFIKGANNLEETFKELASFWYELQVYSEQNLNIPRLRDYLKDILLYEDTSVCTQMFKYILVVRSRYLQMSCAYYLYKKDKDRVAIEFESYNKFFVEIFEIFKEETGCELELEQPPSAELLKRCKRAREILPDITQTSNVKTERPISQGPVQTFLSEIGLQDLNEIFAQEAITMESLLLFTDDDLINIGIEAYGHRHLIIHSLKTKTTSG